MNYYAVSPYDFPTLRDQLLTTMLTSGNPDRNWFAVVDSAFDAGRSQIKWPSEPSQVYFQGRLESLANISPRLLSLSTGDAELLTNELTRLLGHCQGRPMLSFIRAKNTSEDICQSWQSVLELETSDEQRFVLRFADTRITPVIATIFPPSVWARLSCEIDDWRCMDREGNLQSLPVAGPDAERLADLAFLRIDAQPLSRILQSGEADALANVLHEKFPELLPSDQGASVYRRLAAICDLAAKVGLTSSSDLMLLAVAVCLSDGRLLNNDSFLHWLKGHPWASGDFADALDQFIE